MESQNKVTEKILMNHWADFERSINARLSRLLAEDCELEHTNCPVCGSEVSLEHIRKLGMAYRRCAGCGSLFLSPRLPEAILSKHFYDEEMSLRHSKMLLEVLEPFQTPLFRRRLADIDKYAGRRGGKLLDVGCACGGFLLEARSAGWDVTGQDVSDCFLKIAKNRGIPAVKDLNEINPGSIAAATVWATLEHVYAPAALLNEIAVRLKPGGILAIAVPNAKAAGALALGADWPLFSPPEHITCFDPQALSNIVADAGFRIVRLITTCSWAYIRSAMAERGEDPGAATEQGPTFYRKVIERFNMGDMIEIIVEKRL